MSIHTNSRNNFAPVRRSVDGSGNSIEFDQLDLREHVTQTSHPDNRRIQPLPGETWSHLAWRTLGNGQFWWIIADYSRVVDPWKEILRPTAPTYLDALEQDIPPGPLPPAFIQVRTPRRFYKGLNILVEDMASGGVSFEASVVGSDPTVPGRVLIRTSAPLGQFVRGATARIAVVTEARPLLTALTTSRALFECFDFRNPNRTADE